MTTHQIQPEIQIVHDTDLSNIIVTAPSQCVQFHQVLKIANLNKLDIVSYQTYQQTGIGQCLCTSQLAQRSINCVCLRICSGL